MSIGAPHEIECCEKVYPLLLHKPTDKFIERRELGWVRYIKPKKNTNDITHKHEHINLRLCAASYR